jgi:sugar phosphate isomerase/epimerase
MTDLPILGASLMMSDLERFRDLLLELPRDLELQDFFVPEVLDGDWRPYVEAAKRTLDGHEGRLGIHGPFFSLPIAPEDPAVRAIVNRRMHQALDACEVLQATHMVIHSPFTTWSYFNTIRGDATELALIERCHLTLGDVVKRAEDIGCTLVIENIEDIDPFARLRLADSFNSPAVALSIDTGHAHYAHGRTGAPPVDFFVVAAGKRLAHMHVQDADAYADRHWAIGDGTILWPSVFAALKETGATPRLILELQDPSGLRASVDHLSALGLAR